MPKTRKSSRNRTAAPSSPRERPPPPSPETRPPPESNSPPKASTSSAPLSLADWIRQAGPAELADLQALIEQSTSPPPPAGTLIVRTLAQVAEWFGMELQTVKQWRSSSCPGVEGAYDLREIARWRIQRVKNERAEPTRKNELEQQQLELSNARLLLKLKKEAGELVSRIAAKSSIRQMFARLKSQLEPIPELLAPLLPNELRADFRRDCAERVRILLQQISNFRFERDVTGAEITDSENEE